MEVQINSLNQLLIDKLYEITSEMKNRCIQRAYFRNLNLDASNIIEFIVIDYIQ